MRIVGGIHRGRSLAAVGGGDAESHLRPTTDRVRESLFNLLAHGDYPPLEGMRVLDLFAGTGALGLEALSRGAAHAAFVDKGRRALDILRENIRRLGVEKETDVLARDATALPPAPDAPFGLILLDPPYGRRLGERAMHSACAGGWIAPGAIVVWEESAAIAPPGGFTLADRRGYGGTEISILRAAT